MGDDVNGTWRGTQLGQYLDSKESQSISNKAHNALARKGYYLGLVATTLKTEVREGLNRVYRNGFYDGYRKRMEEEKQ